MHGIYDVLFYVATCLSCMNPIFQNIQFRSQLHNRLIDVFLGCAR